MTSESTSRWYQGKTVVVTGAAGFIGSHLVDALLAADATVIGVDNYLTGRPQNLSHLQDHSHFTFVEADVSTDPTTYLPSQALDAVFHFASPASPPRYQAHPIETYLVNSHGTHLLLQHLKNHFPQARFVFASTSEIYGDPEVHPQPESYWGNVNPNGLRSCYDEAKRLGETICGVHCREFQLDVRIVRIFNTYGPRINPVDGRVIPNFISQGLADEPLTIYGDGSQTRSYCYVSDLVGGILALGGLDQARGKTVNLGNPDEFTILETASIIKDLTHNTQAFVFKDLPEDDPTRRRPDIAQATQLLGWEPRVSFKEGLAEVLSYFAQSSDLAKS